METADRAFVVDTLAPKRDIGILADYALGGRGTLAVGLAAPVTPWLQPVAKYERFERGDPAAAPIEAWRVGANLRPWGRATRLTLECVSRTLGDPGVTRALGLAQVQVIF